MLDNNDVPEKVKHMKISMWKMSWCVWYSFTNLFFAIWMMSAVFKEASFVQMNKQVYIKCYTKILPQTQKGVF